MEEETHLWHRRLGRASTRLISKLYTRDLVIGLPKVDHKIESPCNDCIKGKQARVSFNTKKHVSTSKPLELVHIDLYGPMRTQSLNHARYVVVIVDNFSRFTWTIFLKSKDDTFTEFAALMRKTERKLDHKLIYIRSDHGTEFKNSEFLEYCNKMGFLTTSLLLEPHIKMG